LIELDKDSGLANVNGLSLGLAVGVFEGDMEVEVDSACAVCKFARYRLVTDTAFHHHRHMTACASLGLTIHAVGAVFM
jgi:hypothetical protein